MKQDVTWNERVSWANAIMNFNSSREIYYNDYFIIIIYLSWCITYLFHVWLHIASATITITITTPVWFNKSLSVCPNQLILFQKNGRSGHQADSVPVPGCGHKYPGTEHSLDADPHFSKASILVDALRDGGH